MKALKAAVALLVLPLAAFPQAIIEYGAGVGRAGVAGAGVGVVGKSAGQLLDKSSKAMGRVQTQPGKTATPVANVSDPVPEIEVKIPPPGSKTPAIDPAAIPVGLDREELFRQFGKPSMRMTQQQGNDVIEKCWYRAAGFDPVVVTLRNGKVASVGT